MLAAAAAPSPLTLLLKYLPFPALFCSVFYQVSAQDGNPACKVRQLDRQPRHAQTNSDDRQDSDSVHHK